MRTHAKHAVLGGGLVPVMLTAAVAIGNASQQALDLNLGGIALAIYLLGFVAAAAAVTIASLKFEGKAALAELGSPEGLDALAGLAKSFGLGDLSGGSPGPAEPPGPPFPRSSTSPAIAPPPPPRDPAP